MTNVVLRAHFLTSAEVKKCALKLKVAKTIKLNKYIELFWFILGDDARYRRDKAAPCQQGLGRYLAPVFDHILVFNHVRPFCA